MTFVDPGAIGACGARTQVAAARRRATQPSLCENLYASIGSSVRDHSCHEPG
jgi:hypothetical protein